MAPRRVAPGRNPLRQAPAQSCQEVPRPQEAARALPAPARRDHAPAPARQDPALLPAAARGDMQDQAPRHLPSTPPPARRGTSSKRHLSIRLCGKTAAPLLPRSPQLVLRPARSARPWRLELHSSRRTSSCATVPSTTSTKNGSTASPSSSAPQGALLRRPFRCTSTAPEGRAPRNPHRASPLVAVRGHKGQAPHQQRVSVATAGCPTFTPELRSVAWPGKFKPDLPPRSSSSS